MKPVHIFLNTLPLNYDDFLSRYQSAGVGDVIRCWNHSSPSDLISNLWKGYEPVARRIEEVCQRSSEMGVQVLRNAALQDLQMALQVDIPTTLLAHWKSSVVFDFDIQSFNTTEFVSSQTNDQLLIRQLIGVKKWKTIIDSSESITAKKLLVQELNTIIENEDLNPIDAFFDDDTDQNRQARNRNFMDLVWAQVLKPGNRLELWDQMIDETAFVALVPRHRQSVIELAVCNSAVMARKLQFSCDAPIFVNRKPTGILFRLELYFQAVSHSIKTGTSYVSAIQSLRDQLLMDSNERFS
jgi:hypothetical protein